jgi:hypothetical protein
VTAAPMAAVEETPPVTVFKRESAYSAPDHYDSQRRSSVHCQREERRERTNLLVSEDLTPDLLLLGLDEVHVGLHAVDSECLGEEVRDVGVGVETSELQGEENVST